MINELIIDVAEIMSSASKVACLTGAGVSAESGIPTFREKDGVWTQMNPMEWATVDGFRSDPGKVWKWYEQRRQNIRDTDPNLAHIALREMESKFDSFDISTQNIDGLHERAGSSNVLELHGNIFRNKCLECGTGFIFKREYDEPPSCLGCRGMIRPDVVWFGEPLPQDIWNRSFQVAMDCDVYLVIGTSGIVHPAAELALVAKRSDATVVIINPEETELDQYADIVIQMKSGIALPQICDSMVL